MDKSYLVQLLDKYHLGGLIEKASIVVKDKKVSIKTISEMKNLFATITAPDFGLEDCELPVYNTTSLVKLIKITDSHIELSIEKQKSIARKLFIDDNAYKLEYSLADIMMIPNLPTVELPEFETEVDIDLEFINQFLKGDKATESLIFTIEPIRTNKEGKKLIKLVMGGLEKHTHKVSFNKLAVSISDEDERLVFLSKEFGEILNANKDMKIGKLLISDAGLAKLDFETEDGIVSSYLLVAQE